MANLLPSHKGKCKIPVEFDLMLPVGNTPAPVDPCLYAVTKRFRNATVIISECIYCGHIEVSWERQEDTEEITDDEE